MNDDSKKAIDDDMLLAFREGLLDAETQRQVEERLRFSREDRERLAAFDDDLAFMKSALGGTGQDEASPNLWAIRQQVQQAASRRKWVQALAAAAAILLVTSAFLMSRESRNKPVQKASAREYTDSKYLQAAVTQIEYETELLRARLEKSRAPSRQATQPVYAETAAILLESARYWETAGGDAELSKARYTEILTHFPDSAAAAAVVNEKPAVLFGDRSL